MNNSLYNYKKCLTLDKVLEEMHRLNTKEGGMNEFIRLY